ncbi:MAG TPA: hypothetical protein VKH61_17275 [Streptosporangiaceae bacterium]|nr:hypothetical protein [Streptosporangiaceae bacterium]
MGTRTMGRYRMPRCCWLAATLAGPAPRGYDGQRGIYAGTSRCGSPGAPVPTVLVAAAEVVTVGELVDVVVTVLAVVTG